MLSQNERERYDRQIMMTDFGEDGQEKLKRAKIVIAGIGGLGSAASIYLAAAGVGTIRIIDHDKVELSNLNRQILYGDNDIGKDKAATASEKLNKLNPEVKIEAVKEKITESNVSQLVSGFDLIVDAMDNLPTRFLLNKVALDKNMPFFHGAVQGFEGMVTTIIPGETACLRCVYRGATPQQKTPVVGVTPAVVACIQATEVIKYIVGVGKLLTNRLLVYNGLDMQFTELRVKKDPTCEHCGNPGGKKTSER
jgi:molybdopterin/thiamine biosynthesis adenylyltransferase